MSVIDSYNTTYDAVSTTVVTGQTNRDMKANNATLFANVDQARFVRITTDQTVTLRFNSTTNPWIIMTASESPRKFTRAEEGLIVTNIYVTNASWSTANMKFELYL